MFSAKDSQRLLRCETQCNSWIEYNMASITSSATKKKKRKKKGKKKNKSAEGSVGINSTGESSLVDAWTPQSDVRRCEIICGGCGNSWLPFSISSSPWFKFNVSPSIKAAFSTPIGTTEESVHKWVERAETALSGWVLVPSSYWRSRQDPPTHQHYWRAPSGAPTPRLQGPWSHARGSVGQTAWSLSAPRFGLFSFSVSATGFGAT